MSTQRNLRRHTSLFAGENADNEGERAYGREMADKIHQRIDELHAADTVERMIQWNTGRCHLLTQNRKAMGLIHPFRLVFEKKEGGQIVNILEIVDYY